MILHDRKLMEYKERNELYKLRRTQNLDENAFKSIEEKTKKDLDDQLKVLESNENSIKMHLSSIDRGIAEK